MCKALSAALAGATRIPIDLDRDRYVIVSDQHIGDCKGNDDFRLNRQVYKKALNAYFEDGFHLVILGDGEELWECDFPVVRGTYSDVFKVYDRFADHHRLHRVHGNHDIFWRNSRYVRKFLPDRDPPPVIPEALLLETAEGRILLTHGHQGEFFSDKLWRVSRLAVRWIWSPAQRLFGCNNGAAKNVKKRKKREREYYRWAKQQKLLFIAGHTHRAMFGSRSKLDRLRMDLQELKARQAALSDDSAEHSSVIAAIAKKQSEIADCLAKEFKGVPEGLLEDSGRVSPCYFNSGCCSYNDGMTAIEIEQGTIRLVKWDRSTEMRKEYEKAALKGILDKISES